MSKTCWTCGHWLIGGGCWEGKSVKHTTPEYSCEQWVEEGADGTVTGDIWRGISEVEKIESGEIPRRNGRIFLAKEREATKEAEN